MLNQSIPILCLTLALAACSASNPNPSQSAAAQGPALATAPAPVAVAVAAPDTQRDTIIQLVNTHQYFAALAHIGSYKAAHPADTQIAQLEASLLLGTGQAAAAQAAYEQLLARDDSAANHEGLANAFAAQQKYPEAAGEYARAYQRDPLNAQILTDYGNSMMQAGQPEAARVPLMAAVELDRKNQDAARNAAVWLVYYKRNNEALALERAAQLPAAVRRDIPKRVAAVRKATSTLAANSAKKTS